MSQKIKHNQPMINEADPSSIYQQTKARPRQNPDFQLLKIREALIDAIQQNQTLRERVIQLEALLGAAQQQIDSYKSRYAMDLNRLYRIIGQPSYMTENTQNINDHRNRSKSL